MQGQAARAIVRRHAGALTWSRPALFHPGMDTLILASASPRRRELLEALEIPFIIVHPDIDETVFDYAPPAQRVIELAIAKAREGLRLSGEAFIPPTSIGDDRIPGSEHRFVLGADTLVALPGSGGEDWLVLGKPADRDEARKMTATLAGKTHQVFTGIALVDRSSGTVRSALSCSLVTFSAIQSLQLEDYLDTEDWMGAAGAYRIQGRASFHIDRIEGSWSGIMGLPLRELYGILFDADFRMSPSKGGGSFRTHQGSYAASGPSLRG
jgi:septum formation protein